MFNHTKNRTLLNRYFAFVERRSTADRLLWHTVLAVFLGSLIYVGINISQNYTVDIPKQGSSVTEGIVGTPRFVNPVLAITRADHDTSALLFDGLMKIDERGNLAPDIADSIDIGAGGTQYTITLRDNEFFHDGTKLTTEDVAFTIQLIQNPELKSPLRGDWEGVNLTIVDEKTIVLTLPEPYAPFMENLTVGILPAHIWDSIAIEQIPFSEYNTSPVGSGSFMVDNVTFSDTGLITGYNLIASAYEPKEPLLARYNLIFFNNEEELVAALEKGDIDSTAGLSVDMLAQHSFPGYTTYQLPLPRTFSLFYNQNRSAALRDSAARYVLSNSIDKDDLIATVLHGYGISTDSPVPPTFGTVQSNSTTTANTYIEPDAAYTDHLIEKGWKRNEDGLWQKDIDGNTETLAVTIATANSPVFVTTAEYIKTRWETFGIPVTIEQYEQSNLIQNIIRPRAFTILLFGNDTGRALDLYPFWHSSQREDPGLNVAQYTNIDTDALLTSIRTENDFDRRAEALEGFVSIIRTENPAAFLYTPTFVYLVREDITLADMSKLGHPSDRFSNINSWHRGYESLWPFFIKN